LQVRTIEKGSHRLLTFGGFFIAWNSGETIFDYIIQHGHNRQGVFAGDDDYR